jgi:hypothetical protein
MIYLYTIGAMLLIMLLFVGMQHAANWFAHKHPEFGPARKLGAGGCCGKCNDGACEKDGHH